MFRALSPVDPLFTAKFSNSTSHDKWLTITSVENQDYIYKDEMIQIIKPLIGSVLIRTNIKTHKNEKFVVTNICEKRKGCNKGVIDRIQLQPILVINNKTVSVGETPIPFCLRLTNHGNWWTCKMLKYYKFYWASHNFDENSA